MLDWLPHDIVGEIASHGCARALRALDIPFDDRTVAARIIQSHWSRRPFRIGANVTVHDHEGIVHCGRVVSVDRVTVCVLVPAVFRYVIYAQRRHVHLSPSPRVGLRAK